MRSTFCNEKKGNLSMLTISKRLCVFSSPSCFSLLIHGANHRTFPFSILTSAPNCIQMPTYIKLEPVTNLNLSQLLIKTGQNLRYLLL